MRLFLVFLFSLSTYSAGLQAESFAPERDAVHKAWEQLYASFAANDIDKVITFYHEDVVRLAPGGTIQTGRDAVLESFRANRAAYDFKLVDYGEPTILAARDHVTTFNTFEELFTSKKTGEEKLYKGRWVVVWKRLPDGSWKARMTTWHIYDYEDQEGGS